MNRIFEIKRVGRWTFTVRVGRLGGFARFARDNDEAVNCSSAEFGVWWHSPKTNAV